MPAGLVRNNIFDTPVPPKKSTSLFGNPATFTAAADKQASDYDTIMEQYANLARSSISNPITAPSVSTSSVAPSGTVPFSSVSPQLSQYSQSGDVTKSLAGLSDLATTGGYSEEDKANLRERGISPIRSIYANAQRNVDRERSLQGGYSPNYNAVSAKMARELSDQISNRVTDVNAGIAQNVASNRLSAAPNYASASANANAAQTAADARNAAIVNEVNQSNAGRATQTGEFNVSATNAINEANANRGQRTGEFNTQAALEAARNNRSNTLGAIQGQASLYGTTPALTDLFGRQVMQAGQLNQNQQQINDQRRRNMFDTTRMFAS